MLITSSWILDTLICITTAVFFLYKYTSRKFDYWKTRGVTYLPPTTHLRQRFRIIDVYRQVDAPYFGVFIFDEPYLVLKSPDIIKRILIKDFNHFWDRTILAPRHNELFANVMFVQKNPEWKKVRARMTPVFSPAKLKGMMPHINEIGLKLSEYIRKNCDDQLEAKEICAKFTTNVIAKCAFAIDAKCFEEEQAIFVKLGERSLIFVG
ncbi:hypothetical protein NQ318_003777 [Aromia moschata]|uniref:Cytochrome P450 n=1 Tax=Aromia moschata TaxID=1265417 RepID=A0AAV8YKM2_9CUCU|nr:hypothetical protein NQ318_003777 [Aromia moschata]